MQAIRISEFVSLVSVIRNISSISYPWLTSESHTSHRSVVLHMSAKVLKYQSYIGHTCQAIRISINMVSGGISEYVGYQH